MPVQTLIWGSILVFVFVVGHTVKSMGRLDEFETVVSKKLESGKLDKQSLMEIKKLIVSLFLILGF